jgi:energy-converting hydrogenase Eha subunit C
MGSGLIAAVAGLLAFAFVEGFGAYYPSRQTWYRLRRAQGRERVRRMRERLEVTATSRAPRIVALILLVAVAVWAVIATKWLDKDWQEIVFDSMSSVIVALAMLRVPRSLRTVAERMREYERRAGEDPDSDLDLGDGGPAAVAL